MQADLAASERQLSESFVRVEQLESELQKAGQVLATEKEAHRLVNVEMQRGGGKHIISGAVSGDIKFWDIRQAGTSRTASVKTIENTHRSPMVRERAFVHDLPHCFALYH